MRMVSINIYLFLSCIQTYQVDLKPSGSDMVVTNENKKEYIEYGQYSLFFIIPIIIPIHINPRLFGKFGLTLNFFSPRLQQPGDPVEVCQPGAEADERLPGGISVWPQGGDVASDLFDICFRVWCP